MKDVKTVGYYIGQFLAVTIALCATACIAGIILALTYKFLLWLF